jgi:hypothetical protein
LVKKVSGKIGLRIRKSRVNREPQRVNFNTPLQDLLLLPTKKRINGFNFIKGGEKMVGLIRGLKGVKKG